MELTYSPSALPGSCYFCGSGNREFYIDTGCSVEFHGAMYICNSCGNEIALLMKYISHDEYKGLLAEKEDLQKELYETKKQLDSFKGAVDGFVRAGYRLDSELGIVHSGGAVLEALSGAEGAVSTGEDELGEGTGTSPEPSDDKDVGELRPDDAEPKPIFGFLGQDTSEGSE